MEDFCLLIKLSYGANYVSNDGGVLERDVLFRLLVLADKHVFERAISEITEYLVWSTMTVEQAIQVLYGDGLHEAVKQMRFYEVLKQRARAILCYAAGDVESDGEDEDESDGEDKGEVEATKMMAADAVAEDLGLVSSLWERSCEDKSEIQLKSSISVSKGLPTAPFQTRLHKHILNDFLTICFQ